MRRIVESDSSTVVAITGLVGIYNRSTPRLSLVRRTTRVLLMRPGRSVFSQQTANGQAAIESLIARATN